MHTRNGTQYDATYAAHRAYTKRKYSRAQGKTIARDSALRKVVEAYLLDDQSPEMIEGRIRRHHTDLRSISARAIRRYIASPYGRKIEAHRAKVFKKRRKHRPKQTLDGRRPIAKRPKIINTRGRIGDAEGDFIVSGKGGSGIILNITDRKSRAPFFEKIHPVSIKGVERAIARIQKRFPELRTLTLDNDLLFIHHKRLEKKFGIVIYFCKPHAPYEKGTNENRNKILRRYVPKGSDIAKISHARIKKLEEKLQNRIMKCLEYRTPSETLTLHRKRKKTR
jgi:transposase, IS30 family